MQHLGAKYATYASVDNYIITLKFQKPVSSFANKFRFGKINIPLN